MAFLIGGANSAADTGYDIDNSCLFDGTSAYMGLTLGTPTNNKIYTFSAWIKRSKLAQYSVMFNAGGQRDCLRFRGDNDHLHFFTGEATTGGLETNRVFRDIAGWYHIVCAVDTTQSTAANRVKLYVNGVQETSFAVTNYPAQNYTNVINSAVEHRIGKASNVYDEYFGGYIAEVFFIDGQQLTPTSFGEYDEDSPTIWKPKDCKDDLTFGNNGFYLNMSSSSELGTDTSGNSNTFAETNLDATDQATDTPTNNFCTINPLYKWYAAATLSEGNCKVVDTSGGWAGAKGTIAVSKGKWYWEIKLSGTMANHQHGVQEINVEGASAINPGNLTGTTSFYNHDGGEIITDGSATTSDYGTLDSGDILGIALNMDGGSYGQITIYDQNSAIASNINLSSSSDYVIPASFILSSTAEFNFGGCSSFTISSAANDENGYGNFEFAPPSGYLALCTKNLGSDGG